MIQIYGNLNPELHFDLSKTFGAQKNKLVKKLLPAIKVAMNPMLKEKVYDKEILNVIKQLHKSRRDIWRKRNEGHIEERIKGQHIASRRDQVFINLFF